MRAVFGLVLVIGVGLAGFAVYMAKDYIDGYQAELERQRANSGSIDTIKIFVTKKPVTYGEEITKDDVRLVLWPVNSVPKGAYTTAEALFPQGVDSPRAVLRTIEPGEAILKSKLTEPGQPAGLTALLERGKRAFTIEVNVSSGVSGFLRPGHYVDVYWSGRTAKGEVTKLIQTSLPLIAIDQSANEEVKSSGIAKTVTVATDPQNVAALAQAQSTGRLTLALVGTGDDRVEGPVEADQRSLLGLADIQAPEAVVEKEVCTIRTRRGAEVVEIEIPCTN